MNDECRHDKTAGVHPVRLRLYWYSDQDNMTTLPDYLHARTCCLSSGDDTAPISMYRVGCVTSLLN